MSEEKIEKQIQAKGLNAPRLTPALIDAAVKAKDFHVFEGSCLTVCCLTLQNGFTVTGESACASPENFDEQIGRDIAFKNAREKIWALEGYLLKQKLFDEQNRPDLSFIDRLHHEQQELRERLDKLVAFIDTATYKDLSGVNQGLLEQQSDFMLKYLGILEHRIQLLAS